MRLFAFAPLMMLYFITSGCNSQGSVATGQSTHVPEKVTENSIVYVFFSMEKTADGLEKITHTDTKITKGFLKSASIENAENAPGNLLISMLRNDGVTAEERIVEDPLNPVLESYSEEGLNKGKVTLSKGEFSVRFNQKGDITAMKIEKITPNSKKHIITIKL